MARNLKILLLEDRAPDAELVTRRLLEHGLAFDATRTWTEDAFTAALGDPELDLVLADYSLPAYDGLSALRRARERRPELPFIFVSGSIGEEGAVEALRQGATDYVFKDRLARLGPAVSRAILEARERLQRSQAEATVLAREQRIEHLSQVLHAVRDINNLIVREREPSSILHEACRILLRARGYLMTWIAMPAAGSTRAVAASRAGVRADYVDEIQVSFGDSATDGGPVRTAFRTAAACVVDAIDARPGAEPWEVAAASREFRSCAAVPMCHDQRVFGVLQVFADRTAAFDGEETEMLVEVANDLAFALRSIEDEQHRRANEEQVREQASLLDLAHDAISVRDLDDRVWYWNHGARDLYGWEADDAIGRLAWDVGTADSAQYRAAREQLMATGSWAGELTQATRAGQPVVVSSRWTLVRDEGGQPRSVLVIDTNVTEKKQLEAQFLRAQRMESFGQLAGGVAHDFNNILAAMMLQLEQLRSTPGLATEMLTGLGDLDREAQRAAALTRQLLLLGRRQTMQPRRLNLNETVESLVKMLSRLMGEHIEIQLHHPVDGCWVNGDAGMLEQVVMNLCINARDAMPKGGRLTIDIEPASLEPADARRHSEARVGSFIRLSVTDTGTGIEEATLKRIFEPFFTTKEPGKGTGLGLATVYAIARQHQGWVRVDSSVGLGSTFDVYLPAAVAGEERAAPADLPQAASGHETVLLVEDDATVRRLAAAALRRQGYHVLEAANGLRALETWEEHGGAIHLLLTDMVMPEGMTGLDLSERLRELNPRLRVIIASGYAAEAFGPGGQPPDYVHFLPKPFRVAELARAVRDSLDGRSSRSSP
jgi:two-component system, cell cycle sensor histidine kinase and response regulator CckA